MQQEGIYKSLYGLKNINPDLLRTRSQAVRGASRMNCHRDFNRLNSPRAARLNDGYREMMRQLIRLSTCLFLLVVTWGYGLGQKPELIVQTGHSADVSSIAFSPKDKLLASASDDHTVKLWDVASGQNLRTLDDAGNLIAFTPDGTLITNKADAISLWDVISGRELRSIPGRFPIAVSKDGKTLATSGEAFKLWDVTSGRELRTLSDNGEFESLAWSPNGQILATAKDKTIQLWSVSNAKILVTLQWHSEWNYSLASLAFSPDGTILAAGDQREIRLWDVNSGKEIRKIRPKYGGGSSLAFSPDGQILAHSNGLLDVATDVEPAPFVKELTCFSPDGRVLATASSLEREITLWDFVERRKIRTITGGSDKATAIAFSPDGKNLAIGGALSGEGAGTGTLKGIVKVWHMGEGRISNLVGSKNDVTSMEFAPDGKFLVVGHGTASLVPKMVAIYGVDPSSPSGTTPERKPEDSIVIWDTETGQRRNTILGHITVNLANSDTNLVKLSPNGKVLASWGSGPNQTVQEIPDRPYEIKLWEVTTGLLLHAIKSENLVEALVFSSNGQVLASVEYGAIRFFDVETGKERQSFLGCASVNSECSLSTAAFSSDGRIIAGGFSNGTIKLWNTISGRVFRSFRASSESIDSIVFSADGRSLASISKSKLKLWASGSGRNIPMPHRLPAWVKFANVARTPNIDILAVNEGHLIKLINPVTQEDLASLVAIEKDGWLVISPDGLFDGSSVSWSQIKWRFNRNVFDHAPLEAFFNEFYYPGLLTDILAGKRPKADSDIVQKDRRQPKLNLTLSHKQAEDNRKIAVRIKVSEIPADEQHKESSGARDVRLFRNGSLVKVWRGDVLKGKDSTTLVATVPVVFGENTFTAYAFNHDDIKSSDEELIVIGDFNLNRRGTAYIFAIGVNGYSNEEYNLNYAVADAEEFAAEVKRQQEALKRYAKVEVISLTNEQATKVGIQQKLAELAQRAQPEDAVIVFFAGHGTAQGNLFYLIPHDLGYAGPRENLSAAGLQTILAHSISDRELEKLFEGIDAGQLLLVIDACNSGQALEAEEKRRGPMNSKGLAQLAYEKGMYVMTAAQSYQAAMEAAKFGHGYLTYALIEAGLKKGSADREPKNGSIDIREWLNFATDEVPRMQEQRSLDALRGRGRYVVFVGDGRKVGIPKTEADARDNIQRPRVFYRRELELNPLVVAVVGSLSPQ